MKIYFAGSIRGGREDVALYQDIIKDLQNYGVVLTEHIGSASLTSMGEDGITDEYIHDRDMDWLLSSDVIVAEVTNPSLGVGYEIGRAIDHGKKILCLYRNQPEKKLSAMISGSKDVVCKTYDSLNDAKEILKDYF